MTESTAFLNENNNINDDINNVNTTNYDDINQYANMETNNNLSDSIHSNDQTKSLLNSNNDTNINDTNNNDDIKVNDVDIIHETKNDINIENENIKPQKQEIKEERNEEKMDTIVEERNDGMSGTNINPNEGLITGNTTTKPPTNNIKAMKDKDTRKDRSVLLVPLDKRLNAPIIQKHFIKYGDIENIISMKNSSSYMVIFENINDAKKCIELFKDNPSSKLMITEPNEL